MGVTLDPIEVVKNFIENNTDMKIQAEAGKFYFQHGEKRINLKYIGVEKTLFSIGYQGFKGFESVLLILSAPTHNKLIELKNTINDIFNDKNKVLFPQEGKNGLNQEYWFIQKLDGKNTGNEEREENGYQMTFEIRLHFFES